MADKPTNLYTRTGDNGTTGLVGRKRVQKDSMRIHAIGEVDEINSILGVARSHCLDELIKPLLQEIQNILFELGAELAQPGSTRLVHAHSARLEQFIDRLNEALPALTNFILPGGGQDAAYCHLARSVCRRAERTMFRLSRTEHVNSASLQFINRLSDLLFVVARTLNHRSGTQDIAWKTSQRERKTS